MNRFVAAVATACVIQGCALPPASRLTQVALPAPYTQQGIGIVVDGLYRDGYGNVLGVSGEATNLTGRDLVTVMVTLDVVDGAGTKVSSAIASTTGLKASQRWRFQAHFLNAYAVSFRAIEPGNIIIFPPR